MKKLLLFISIFIVHHSFAQDSPTFWTDDFSVPSNWVIDHDATACNLDWEIGAGLSTGGSFAISTIESTTASNGFAMIDSDEYGGEEGGTDIEDSWFTTANPIDLSSATTALLQFETWYRRFNSEQCFVVISTTNDDWPELTPDFDASTNPNVFSVFPNIANTESLKSNPTLKGINISEVAANESQVWVRFHWTGTWGYAWFVDDVSIVEMPSDEIILNYGYFSMGGSEEFGRTPASQMNDTIILGGEVFNFGSADQINVTLDATISNSGNTVISVNTVQSLLESDSTAYIQDFVTNFAPLEVGNYNLSVNVSSDGDNASGENFSNNSYSRSFAVTENLYSLDGIGVYDDESLSLSVLGSNSFTDNEDGLIIMNYYEIRETTTVSGLQAAISNADSYSAGAEIAPFILSLEAWNEEDVYDRIVEGDFSMVSESDLNEGEIWLPFEETELEPGIYFACVELYSGSGTNHVGILDDETVAQPNYATGIYLPSDQTFYTNGNAAAIRLFTGVVVMGCTDIIAQNFNEDANTDDGSCTYSNYGCLDSTACNYNSQAIIDDGSCSLPELYYDCNNSCMNDIDFDGVCDELEVEGCTDPLAINYDSDATDDGSCTYSSYGCMDLTACNYDSQAIIDNNTCYYFDIDPNVMSFPATFTGEEYVDGELSSSYDLIFHEDGTASTNNGYEFSYSVCSNIYVDSDSYYGDWDANTLSISGTTTSGNWFEYSYANISPIMGCTDEVADNFNSEANFDDGSCIYSDAEAFVGNYSAYQSCGSGEYELTQEITSSGNYITLINAFGFSWTNTEGNNITIPVSGNTFNIIGAPATIYQNDVEYSLEYDINGYMDLATGDVIIDYIVYVDYQDGNGMVEFDNCDVTLSMIPYFGDSFDGAYDATEECSGIDPWQWEQVITSNGNEITLIEAFGWGVDITIPLYDESYFSLYDYETTIVTANGEYAVTYSSIEGQLLDGNIDVTYIITTEDENGEMQEFSNCSATMTYSNELIEGCTDSIACNYNEAATVDDGSCSLPVLYYDCDNNCMNDLDSDGICDELEVEGCTDPLATNYESYATDDNGSCIPVIDGCTDAVACNYNSEANNENGSCQYPEMYYDCDGSCLNDYDEDGVCDQLEIEGCTDMLASNYNPLATEDDESCNYNGAGCMDETACNYNIDATEDDGSCMFAELYFDCNGNCIEDNDENGVCDQFQIGCPYEEFVEYDSTAFYFDVNLCETYIVYGCTNANYLEYDSLATNDDNSCETLMVYGCTNQTAVNFNSQATIDDASCIIYGCTLEIYPNYNSEATVDDGSCSMSSDFIYGCMDDMACNYNVDATNENGSCIFAELYYDCDGNCTNDSDSDGVCDELEIEGCTDSLACNFNPNATEDDESCENAEIYYDCSGNCINDTDDDGVCDELEVAGCTDPLASNFDPNATDDDLTCVYSIEGCTDSLACNFNSFATEDDGSCTYAQEYYDCDGNCINDADFDGICDEQDNCINESNSDQLDSDADGEGDVCDYDDGIGIEEITDETPVLIKMIDVLGREQLNPKKGMILFYIYSNGVVEKILIH